MSLQGYEDIYHNNHNVFILGAGFSVDAGLPVVNNVIKKMRLAASSSINTNKREIAEGINGVLKWRLFSASAAHRCKIDPNNIEELFSLIDGDRGGNGQWMVKKETMQKAIISTLSFCAKQQSSQDRGTRLFLQPGLESRLNDEYLVDKIEQSDNPLSWILPIYDAIASVFSGSIYSSQCDSQTQKNTIITFNYDTVIEDAFERIGEKFNLGLPGHPFLSLDSDYKSNSSAQGGEVTSIFKLHGSINWRLEQSEPLKLVIRKDLGTLWSQISHKDNYILEPPTWNKGRSAEILQHLWDASLASIRNATRIFIIGYSLPETDMHFKYLMASGLAQNISLESICFVNPAVNDPVEFNALSKRVFRIFREELQMDGTIEFIPSSATSFILAENGSRSLNGGMLPFRLYPELEHSFFSRFDKRR